MEEVDGAAHDFRVHVPSSRASKDITIERDLVAEITFLLGFDAARERLNRVLDWPDHSLDLFIRLVHQNRGALSKAKRQSHFAWMGDAELARCEAIVAEAFAT